MQFALENLRRSDMACRHEKRNAASMLGFEARSALNLLRLRETLRSQTYEPSRSVCSLVRRPRARGSSSPIAVIAQYATRR